MSHLSISAHLHPVKTSDRGNLTRVSNCRSIFDELNSQVFDFTNGFKCSDVTRFGKLKIILVNIFELSFHQLENDWKQISLPIQNSEK